MKPSKLVRKPHYSQVIAEATASRLGERLPSPTIRVDGNWQIMATGGDSLHLRDVLDHLLGSVVPDEGEHPATRLVHDSPTGPHREASLLLDRYAGWYGALTRLGVRLPNRTDGQSWRVHVTVAPLGYLGTYRQSRMTGRWFAGRHRWHVLGWTE
jgi:hypothetical protein